MSKYMRSSTIEALSPPGGLGVGKMKGDQKKIHKQ